MRMHARRLVRRAGLLTAVAVVMLLASVSGAWALENAGVTTRNNIGDPSVTFGGLPSRFTFTAATGATETVRILRFDFPKGTVLTKARYEIVTLAGLAQRPVRSVSKISAETLTLDLTPAIAPKTNITVRVFDVVPPESGGTFALRGVETLASGQTAPFSASFQTSALTPTWKIVNWLNTQPWVTQWNANQFLGIFLNPQVMVRAVPLAFTGWLLSIALVLGAFPTAIPFGLALAFMKMSRVAPLRWLASLYINFIRGTPLFLQIYIAFFALPLAGVRVPDYPLGVIVLALNSSAYLAEIFRAGIQSISKGQFEAASSLGMTYAQAMTYVIIPQTVKRVLPTMTSEFILLFKDTALLSAPGVFELMKMSQGLAANTGTVAPYVVAAAFYLVLTVPLINFVGNLEARLAVSENGGSGSRKKRRPLWRPASAGAVADLEASSIEHSSR